MAGEGKTFAVVGGGVLLVWSAINNTGVLATVRDLIQGSRPVPGSNQVSVGTNSSSSTTTQDDSLTTMSDASSAAQGAVGFAVAQVGKWYGWGKTGPDQFDCSGLVYAAYKSVGVSIPRVTEAQILYGTTVSVANAIPGDLMFPEPGHVVMCVGGGQCVEAAHTGTQIRVRSYVPTEFIIAKRVA